MCLLSWALLAAGPAHVVTCSTAAPAATTAPTSTAALDVKEVRTKAFSELLAGRFQAGLALLEQAAKASPDDAAAQAQALTAGYLKVRAKADVERHRELAAAARRVELARLAEKHRPTLIEQKLDGQLYEHGEAIVDAFRAANDVLTDDVTSQPADAVATVGKNLDLAVKELTATETLVGDGHGEWGQEYRQAAGHLREALASYRKVWQTARMPQDRPAVRSAAEDIQDALLDMGVLISRNPLAAALAHAGEAKDLAGDSESFLEQDWVRQLVRDAAKRGDELLAEGKWTEAMVVYGHAGLSDLDRDNLGYAEKVKRINHHVRVLNLYGGEPSTQPAAGGAVPVWREMIGGIDTRMVRNAISQIDYNYVGNPDYRKIGVAALDAVKVLAETSQAAAAFPALRDESKRSAFLKELDEQVRQLRNEAAVDHLHVKRALNRILELNEETLDLPPEVINMEFAEGMTGELDRFTTMVWPFELEDFNKRTMGSFFGIGVKIRKDKGKPIEVITPLPDTPAFRKRILAGDLILRVDGMETQNMRIDKAVEKITGPRHTTVTLTIQRRGVAKPFDVIIERDEIHIQTVEGWRRLPDGKWNHLLDRDRGIGYVRVTQFTEDTITEIREALQGLRQAGANGLILDLRFNPGGLLTSAVEVADEFLPRGLIVRTKGRNVRETSRSAGALGQYQEGKVVVLVNRVSASAAEIVSGALKDWGRSVVVGERTYGKGSVQRLIPLQSGQARLKLTTAYYYLPSGKLLHRTNGAKNWGVSPAIDVPVTSRQVNRWMGIRQETELLKKVEPETLTRLLGQQLREDLQLQTALLVLRLHLLAEAT